MPLLTSATLDQLILPENTVFESYARQTPLIGKYIEIIYLWNLFLISANL